jgi:DsbC/DsbD-like thiol-disulfide interchange protein
MSKRVALRWLSLVLLPVAALAMPAAAQTVTPWNDHPHSRVRLVASSDNMVGVELVLAPGWKTYWRMPGDAGVPPTFDWAGSKNVGEAHVHYPVPTIMPDSGGVAVGYMGAVTFPVRLAPADPTAPVTVRLALSYGVCKDVCIPIDTTLEFDLPAGLRGLAAAPQVTSALARVPRRVDDAARSIPALTAVKASLAGARPHMRFITQQASAVLIEAPDGLFVPMAMEVSPGVFEVDLSKTPDRAALVGQDLRITLATEKGGVETTWRLIE